MKGLIKTMDDKPSLDRIVGIATIRILLIGTLISVVAGVITYFLKGLYECIQVTLVAETLVLLLSVLSGQIAVNADSIRHNERVVTLLSEMKKIVAASSVINETVIEMETTHDPIVNGLYKDLMAKLGALSDGMYELSTIEDVYRDDAESIAQMNAGDILRSTCPLDKDNPEAQINHKGFQESVIAHINAAKSGVDVRRLYLVTDRSTIYKPAVVAHLGYLHNNDVAVRVLCLPDANNTEGILNHDCLIFGTRKVSVGITDGTGWLIKGASIVCSEYAVETHSRIFENKMYRFANTFEELFPSPPQAAEPSS